MSTNAPVLRKIVNEATDDLLSLVLATQQGVSTTKLAAERRERAAPCWRLTCRGKQETERELHGRSVEVAPFATRRTARRLGRVGAHLAASGRALGAPMGRGPATGRPAARARPPPKWPRCAL